MGIPMELAWQAGNSRRGHWFTTYTLAVNMAMTKERLINSGFYDLATAYQFVARQLMKPPCTERYARWLAHHNLIQCTQA